MLRSSQDIRFGLRQLRRSPGFMLTVVGVLALGIGANSAMFTVLDGTLLRRLPYREPNSLVLLSTLDGKGETQDAHIADIEQWQKRSRTLEGIAFYDQDRRRPRRRLWRAGHQQDFRSAPTCSPSSAPLPRLAAASFPKSRPKAREVSSSSATRSGAISSMPHPTSSARQSASTTRR